MRGCGVSIGRKSFCDTVYDSVAEPWMTGSGGGERIPGTDGIEQITGLETSVTLLGREGIGVKVLEPDRP